MASLGQKKTVSKWLDVKILAKKLGQIGCCSREAAVALRKNANQCAQN
jgi:hypothetical protein